MKLVLSVSAIGEQAEGRCPWTWIDLGPRLAQKALERTDVFRLAEEKDDNVIELYYVSLEGIFFNPWLAAVETLPMNSLFLNGPWSARKSRR